MLVNASNPLRYLYAKLQRLAPIQEGGSINNAPVPLIIGGQDLELEDERRVES